MTADTQTDGGDERSQSATRASSLLLGVEHRIGALRTSSVLCQLEEIGSRGKGES